MRIGIDIRKYNDYGIGTYIQNLLKVYQSQPDLDMIYYASVESISGIEGKLKGKVTLDHSPKYSIRELWSLARKANTDLLDVYHAPHYTLPVNLKMPSVVTIHDIIHIRMKEYYSFPKRMYAYRMVQHACSASSAIIVDSEFGKKELMDVFSIAEKKINVIHLGVDNFYFEKSTDAEKEKFLRKYSINRPYILYTGSLKPHKNVPVLLRAFKEIMKKHHVQLVFTGEQLYEYPELVQYISENGMTDAVCDLGRIDRTELRTAYQASSVVVLPSRYEGFGFSMLEAMASGVPAIGARAASIPEVLGDAGLLFDPSNQTELEVHLNSILTESNLRETIVAKGKERARQFSWTQCAENTLKVYRKVTL